jgi:hypothetical protein
MRVLLLTSALFLGGCATLIHGSSQSIRVESEPEGAQVEVDGRPVGRTPTTVDLSRDQDHRVRLHHSGYEAHTVTLQQGRSLWASVNLLNLIVPGMLVDLSTGAFYRLDPEPVSPTLDETTPTTANSP